MHDGLRVRRSVFSNTSLSKENYASQLTLLQIHCFKSILFGRTSLKLVSNYCNLRLRKCDSKCNLIETVGNSL